MMAREGTPVAYPMEMRLDRRSFILTTVTALTAALAACGRERPVSVNRRTVSPPSAPGAPGPNTVTIIDFADNGGRIGPVDVAKVVKTDAEWREQLSDLCYTVTRKEGTERPFTGPLNKEHRKGIFRCICCDTAVFSSEAKFESGTGWPSFWQPIAPENVTETTDVSFGMTRTAVSCARCDAHLGHVFPDGPPPTGQRYCMNSAAMTFSRMA